MDSKSSCIFTLNVNVIPLKIESFIIFIYKISLLKFYINLIKSVFTTIMKELLQISDF